MTVMYGWYPLVALGRLSDDVAADGSAGGGGDGDDGGAANGSTDDADSSVGGGEDASAMPGETGAEAQQSADELLIEVESNPW